MELTDGRLQEIAISNLMGPGKELTVTLRETKAGQEMRVESSTPSEGVHP